MKQIKSIVLIIFIVSSFLYSQEKDKDKLVSSTFNSLKFRSIGPAWTSGRISDFAVNPNNFNEYYVATSSGGLWKTTNNGTTWISLTDTIQAYAMGCVTLDPNNPHTVWLGTGENNHQRALGYGTGVYKSTDGGFTWNNMGLKDSRQIGGIIIDPRNSNVVFVAAEGSVWGPGGDRGLYKSTDGGKNWNKVLHISEHTGVNNIIFDPRNPDWLYATSEQRRRHIWTKIGGGPESAVYRSTDGGNTWEKIMKGLPTAHIGGTGIAVSPANPDVVYLSVDAAEKQGGFFRSTNRGSSWEKMSDTYASGQYFNEIICDPKDVNKVYLMDVYSKVTLDGGKTFKQIGSTARHVDDHALWINPTNTDHLMIGGDGGIYVSYDGGNNWEFKANLPVTQFYRVNVDNDKPFYNIYGGTQDNQSMGGPSQTINKDGIVNSDWFETVGGDGFFQAIDPTDPNIVYSEWQYGNIIRYDKKSGELLNIRPEPGKGEKTYKWYWDTPFFISPHSHTRLYIAAERVFRSDDRGESWKTISGDLTTQTDRNTFKVMDKYWSIDANSKDVSTSLYGLIVSLAESPLKPSLIYAGTDDGIIQVTENEINWRRIDKFPGVPEFTLVSDILPSRFNENVVYATFNNHKFDDFKPYVIKSEDKGKSWKSISGNLPDDGAVNCIVEDPVNPNLLFVGTEWGVFFSPDGGNKWIQLKSGIPQIKVPDIVIQEEEMDLVVATFGRGFYVIDDYSPLRLINKEFFNKESFIFPIKDAKQFIMKGEKYGQGAAYYRAPNPEYGTSISFYVKDVPKTLRDTRKEKEKELFKDGKPIPQPSTEELKAEENQLAPYFILTITDKLGSPIRKINKSASSGIHRIYWDLRYESTFPVSVKDNKFDASAKTNSGMLVMPGKYNVELSMVFNGEEKKLFGPVEFNVVPLNNTTLPADNRQEVIAFQNDAYELARTVIGTKRYTIDLINRIELIKQTINNAPSGNINLFNRASSISQQLNDILFKFTGTAPKASREEIPPAEVPLDWRLEEMIYTQINSTSNVTQNQRIAYEVLKEETASILIDLKRISENEIKQLEAELEKINAPWTPGRFPELK